jgi:hypothetical protein
VYVKSTPLEVRSNVTVFDKMAPEMLPPVRAIDVKAGSVNVRVMLGLVVAKLLWKAIGYELPEVAVWSSEAETAPLTANVKVEGECGTVKESVNGDELVPSSA